MSGPGDDLPRVTIYTDGGCRPNPGPGGWGVVLLSADGQRRELSGGEAKTTNNRMELRAAIEALSALDGRHSVELFTDSEYVKRGITEWLERWRSNGWRTAAKGEVRNQDLWRQLSAQLERHEVEWRWTRGHSGDRWNERADRLAAAEIARPSLPVDDPGAVHLFTAVAYSGKAGAGGWAALLDYRGKRRTLDGCARGTTSNRLHLEAAAAGLGALRRRSRVHVYTVSDYLADGASRWVRGWQARGWKTREGRQVRHRQLWERIGRLGEDHEIVWHVVAGDALPEELEQVKAAAREALAGAK